MGLKVKVHTSGTEATRLWSVWIARRSDLCKARSATGGNSFLQTKQVVISLYAEYVLCYERYSKNWVLNAKWVLKLAFSAPESVLLTLLGDQMLCYSNATRVCWYFPVLDYLERLLFFNRRNAKRRWDWWGILQCDNRNWSKIWISSAMSIPMANPHEGK